MAAPQRLEHIMSFAPKSINHHSIHSKFKRRRYFSLAGILLEKTSVAALVLCTKISAARNTEYVHENDQK